MRERSNSSLATRFGDGVQELPAEARLRRKVAPAFAFAVLLTSLLGFLSWRVAQQAAKDASWVSHTHEVMTMLEATVQHLVDVETAGRGFALTGHELFLEPYEPGRRAVHQDVDALRPLTADNPDQQRRLDVLGPQVIAKIEASDKLVAARRRTGAVPTALQLERGRQIMKEVRATARLMEAEEERLLVTRTQKARRAQRLTISIGVLGSLLGMVFLVVAGVAISRQVAASARARAQLSALNADLECRVEQRTAALQSEMTVRNQAEQALAIQAEELARSRQTLEAQTLMLQSVLDSMAEGLVAADDQGKFLIWNRAAGEIVGHGPADLPTEEWSKHYGNYLPDGVTLFPTEQLPLVRAIHGETSTTEIFLRSPKVAEGTWIEARGAPLKDQDGAVRGGVVAFRDITQRKTDEREIRKLNDELEERVVQRTAQLEEANRELEAFTYSVSHDLRAPLRHMSGFTKILVEDFGPSLPADAQRYLQRVEQGALRMGLLVDELLNLTHVGRQSLAIQVTGLGSIVKDVQSLLGPEAEGRKVEWKIGDLPFVECDPTLVRLVFQNLIGNALKYSRPRSPAVIEIGQIEKDGQPVIFVRDNGVGFSMKYADKLFGVFQRLHRPEDFEGTGVGLATVQRIVQKHGGRVWTEAALDKGATFYFTLGGFAQSVTQNADATAGG